MLIIGEWLDATVAERGNNGIVDLERCIASDEPSEFIGDALALRVAGLSEGYTEKELVDACRGDVARYIMNHHTARSLKV